MRKHLHRFLTLILIFFTSIGFSQSYDLNGNDITDCSGFFYDSGGSTGNYSPNEAFEITICSDATSGTHVQLVFAAVELAAGDLLCFYDGTDSSAPFLACNDDFLVGSPFIIQATAANPSGCLTITFNSDGTGEAAGWQADMNCIPSCQTILAELVSSTPIVSPPDTGYIDICQGERVFFNGEGNYPQNGTVYNHSDLTSSFEWDYGDGVFGVGPNVSHIYNEPGGYIVQLTITDQFGCTNTNLISQRVRVSPNPSFSIMGDIPEQLCAGDTVELNAVINTVDSTYAVGVSPTQGSFPTAGVRSDSLALPDGTGAAYETSILFSNFTPGQVLTDVQDLVSICVVMEHSWMRDLEISIECPDGTSIILHDHPGNFGGEVFLGEPFEADETLPEPIPGVGYEYCWTPNATAGTWIEYANNSLSGGSGTLPPGNYNSFDPLSDLLGCPLNGEWTIHVEDLWGIDNGFIFEWSIEFESSLYPNIETFTPQIINYNWQSNPSIFFETPDSIAAAPQNAGTASYTFEVEDEFGCMYDTSVLITILPPTHPDCFECPQPDFALADTTICEGNTLQIDAENTTSLADQNITFESFPGYLIGNANHPPTDPYAAPLEITTINPGIINNAQAQICGVCLDLETDFDADIRIFLRSPSGETMELSTNNGGAGDNYTNTCFSSNASTPITSGSAPFTGDFVPEGNWSDLDGSTINGTWELLITDGFGINDFGVLNSWSICFNTQNDVVYNWAPVMGLSCYNCPDPIANPSTTSTYSLEISDDFGCSYLDTMTVNVTNGVPAPTGLDCIDISNGTITFGWDEIPGVSSYLVNINGTGWVNSNGGSTHLVSGLNYGDIVSIEVQANIVSVSCNVLIANADCTYENCDVVNISAVATVSGAACFGENSGSIIIDGMGGAGTYSYLWSNGSADKDQLSLSSGTYTVTISDANGCETDSIFTISQPNEITLDLSATPTTCSGGGNDGSATVLAQGGTGINYNFLWTGGQTNSTATNLVSGTYTVLVTDGSGCTASESIDVTAPDAITVDSIVPTDVLCFGGNSGFAEVFATSGNGNLSYVWSDPLAQFSNPANSLASGTYTVTITDPAFCTATATIFVDQPEILTTTIDPIAVNCFGGNDGSAIANPTGGVEPYAYAWNTLPGQFTQSIDQLQMGAYVVTITDFNGCTTTQSTQIQEPATAVTAVASQTLQSCFNQNNSEAEVFPAGGVGPDYTFSWSNGASMSTASGLAPQTYFVTVTDQNGCEGITNIEIIQLDEITVNAIQVEPSCFEETDGQLGINIVQGGIGGGDLNNYDYAWSNGVSGVLNGNIISGNYTVTVVDAQGCTAEESFNLDQPNPITASAQVMDADCFGAADGQLEVTANGDFPISNYQWDSNANSQMTATATNLAAGNYIVTITDNTNCSIISSFSVGQPTSMEVSFETDDNPCFSDNLGAITTTISGGTPGYSYTWINSDTVGIFTSTDQNLTELFANLYTVTVTDGNGCTFIDSVSVNSPPALWAILSTDSVTCFDDRNGSIFAEGMGGAAPYRYSLDGGEFSATNAFLGLGVGNYSVAIQDKNGCETDVSTNVEGPEPITVDLGENITINFGEVANLNAAVNPPGNYFYTWSPDDSLTCLDCPSTSALGLNFQTTFQVIIEDEYGCTATDFINVYVNKFRRVYIPTGFSPNNDGNNDLLLVHGEEGTTIHSFKVFDRWGEMVYENLDPFGINLPDLGWDGTFRGEKMNPGIFLWVMEVEYIDGSKEILKGHTTLIR